MSPLLATSVALFLFFILFLLIFSYLFSAFGSFLCLPSGLVFIFVCRSSHPLSSFSSAGSTASVVSGVASSALEEGSDGSSSCGIFYVASVPKYSVAVFRSFGISG